MNALSRTELPDPQIRKITFDWADASTSSGSGHSEFWFGVVHPAPTAEELGDVDREFNATLRRLIAGHVGTQGSGSLTIHWDDSFSVGIPIPSSHDRVRIDTILQLIDLVTELRPDSMQSEVWSTAHERLRQPSLIASGFM